MNVGSSKELPEEHATSKERGAKAPPSLTVAARHPTFRAWEWIALTAFAGWIVCAHVMTLGYMKYANVDEAYAAAIGERLLQGYKLYDGAVSQRGPLMYYFFEVFDKLVGWDNVLAMRVAALIFSLAHFTIVVWAARKLSSRTGSVIAGLIVAYGLAIGFNADEAIALHGEVLLVPLLTLGVAFGALAMRSGPGSTERIRQLAIAGALLGAAGCIKPTVLVHPAPIFLWLLLEQAQTQRPFRDVAGEVLVHALSFAAIPFAFLAHAAIDGTIGQLIYYCYTYNVNIHTHAMGPGHIWHHPISIFILAEPMFTTASMAAIGLSASRWLARLAATIRTRARFCLSANFDVKDFFGLQFALAFFLAAWLPQEFEHYFVVALPLLALTLASYWPDLPDNADREQSVAGALLMLAGLGTYLSCHEAYAREKTDGRIIHDAVVERAAHYLEQATSPNDKIFVWGFSPWLYTYSHRRPAGRFVFTTYPIGFVPWFWQALDREPDHVVPGTMDQLLGDLDREKPEYVVDAGSIMMGRPMRAYQPALTWLQQGYCFDARFGSYDLYRRRPESGNCTSTDFPKQAPTVDFFGAPLGVMSAVDIDLPTSRFLPPGDPLKPLRFDYSTDVCIDQTPILRAHIPDRRTCNFNQNAIYDGQILSLDELTDE